MIKRPLARLFVLALAFVIVSVSMFGWAQEPLTLDEIRCDALFDALEHTITLNDGGHYLEAYRAAVVADNEMDRALEGYGVSQLSESDFELLFWPIKKSRAEVAYKLGLHGEMARLHGELISALQSRTDLEQSWRDAMNADCCKIDGGCQFLNQAYDEAILSLHQALKLKQGDPGFTNAVRDDLAQAYYAKGDYPQALAQLDSLLADFTFSNSYRNTASEQERQEIESQRALCLARMRQYQEALDLISTIATSCKDSNSRLYAEALRKQGKILMLQYDSTGQYDAQAQRCYSDYLAVMKAHIDNHFLDMDESEREQFWMAEQPFVTDCYRLEDKDSELLYDVALFSKAVLLQMGRDFNSDMSRTERQRVLASMRVKWRDVQQSLPRGSAAIEFITYQKNCDKDHLAALVITKGATKPIFIPIGPAADIMDYHLATGRTVSQTISANNDACGVNVLYSDTTLGAIIWNDKLLHALSSCKSIYFAADGFFHLLAVEYLVPPTMNDVKCYRLTSTRLLTERRKGMDTKDMLMCGYADFNNSVQVPSNVDNDAVAFSIMASQSLRLNQLPGTLNEIEAVREIRADRTGDVVLLGDSASESIVRKMLQQHHLALIATHGIFTAPKSLPRDLVPDFIDTQLSQSCLFLAGTNANMREPQFDGSQPDGILSARELAGMKLDHLDLAVLSACLSGRGQISADGVYGLQRGLKSAGVRALVVSLWEVDDTASGLMMKYLFERLEQGVALHDAFNQARTALREHQVIRRIATRQSVKKPFDNPYYYNAFILIDGI